LIATVILPEIRGRENASVIRMSSKTMRMLRSAGGAGQNFSLVRKGACPPDLEKGGRAYARSQSGLKIPCVVVDVRTVTIDGLERLVRAGHQYVYSPRIFRGGSSTKVTIIVLKAVV